MQNIYLLLLRIATYAKHTLAFLLSTGIGVFCGFAFGSLLLFVLWLLEIRGEEPELVIFYELFMWGWVGGAAWLNATGHLLIPLRVFKIYVLVLFVVFSSMSVFDAEFNPGVVFYFGLVHGVIGYALASGIINYCSPCRGGSKNGPQKEKS